ncbi:MAG TPA: pitrilysin family protein [Casimicrobiaceae bacterium]|nr:pitrilysin family protein [Casimicrobiaceae bacterium]
MNRRPFRPLTPCLLLAFGLLAGPCPASSADAPAGVRVAQGGDVLRATLDNGLRVVVVRDTLAPTVTTQMTYLAGAYQAPKGFPGTAHALEHMMFRDNKGFTGAQLNEITGKMGGDNNAFTTNDATQYSFVAPAAYLGIILHIEARRMRGALLTDDNWKLEKGAIEQEVSSDISDPGFLAFEQAEQILYAGTGYADDPLGTRPSFDRTTAKTLRTFYDAWYQPGNAILVIVGDVDPQATLAEVRTLFGPIPSRPTPVRKAVVLQAFEPRTIVRTTPSGTGSVQFLYRMPGAMSRENAAAQVLLDALNNPRSGLSDLAAQGKVLGADAQIQPFSHGGIGVVEASFPKGGNPTQAKAELDRVIGALLANGVSPDLVEAAKRSELAQFEFNKNSAVSVASSWSQALAWQGLDSPEAAEQQLRRVTVDDVNRIAREYLRPDRRVTIVLAPDPNGKRPPNSSGFGGSESFAGDDKLDVPLPEWAAKALGKLELPHWTLAPTRTTLPNGITLVVQPESVSKTVTVFGHVDHDAGLQEPEGQEGVGRLLSTLFDYGTTTLDRTAFHEALDAIAATESGGDDFSLAVPSESFDRGVQLLADNELHPAIPPQAFSVQQQSLARMLAGELQSPRYRMVRALRQGLLPAGDPHLREATPSTVARLGLDDVRSYFDATYRPDLTTIVVVGDVTPDEARATIERYFGSWQARGPKPDVVPPKVPRNPPAYVLVPNAYASQDQVLMGQVLDLDLHNPDRYALQLGNDVLGGNGFASRLMTDVRVKHGYAYDARSGMSFDRSRSIFYVEYGSDPDKVALVDALVLRDIEAMRRTPVKDDELDNARQYQIRSIPLAISSVQRIAGALLTWSYKGEPLDQPMVAARRYLDLTAKEVQDAFTHYLQPRHLVQVVQGPAPTQH